jgi:hypothetical protein
MHYTLIYFGKELYIFETDLLSIIRSFNTVFTAIGICYTSYVDCLLAEFFTKINLRNSASR